MPLQCLSLFVGGKQESWRRLRRHPTMSVDSIYQNERKGKLLRNNKTGAALERLSGWRSPRMLSCRGFDIERNLKSARLLRIKFCDFMKITVKPRLKSHLGCLLKRQLLVSSALSRSHQSTRPNQFSPLSLPLCIWLCDSRSADSDCLCALINAAEFFTPLILAV